MSEKKPEFFYVEEKVQDFASDESLRLLLLDHVTRIRVALEKAETISLFKKQAG